MIAKRISMSLDIDYNCDYVAITHRYTPHHICSEL